MQSQKINSHQFVVRVKRGEKIIEELKKFCLKMKIRGGFFYGLGAVDEVTIAHYDVGVKKYSQEKFNLALEMANITGSIGIFEKEIIIHAHATLADKNMKTIGGHLVEATVSGTAEIFLTTTPPLQKKYDPETGLKLFELSSQKPTWFYKIVYLRTA